MRHPDFRPMSKDCERLVEMLECIISCLPTEYRSKEDDPTIITPGNITLAVSTAKWLESVQKSLATPLLVDEMELLYLLMNVALQDRFHPKGLTERERSQKGVCWAFDYSTCVRTQHNETWSSLVFSLSNAAFVALASGDDDDAIIKAYRELFPNGAPKDLMHLPPLVILHENEDRMVFCNETFIAQKEYYKNLRGTKK